MMNERIPTQFPFQSHYVDILGAKIHYIEQGTGDPILLLHSVPASSYVWRNIIPHLSTLGRCIAPDLIGMGKSDKPAIQYTISEHIKYIDEFIRTLNLKKITLIMHGWGSIIGIDYAMRHEQNCKGLVFYEAYLRAYNDDDVSLPYQEQLQMLQRSESDFDIIADPKPFVDNLLSQVMIRPLAAEELNYYREPFAVKGSGQPLHQYIQELPTSQGQSAVDKLIASNANKLMQSSLPKLLLYSVPGFTTTIATAMWAKENLSHLEIADVGEALHYAQESNPTLMGETISIWLQGIEQTQ